MNSFTATDPTDKPTAPRPVDQQVQFKLGVGDRSTSHSEDYVLNVFRIDPLSGAEQRIHTLRSGGFGQYAEIYKSFKIGETYTFQIQWVGTNKHAITTGTGSSGTIEGPDWDYHLVVAPQGTDTGGSLIDSYDPAKKTIGTAPSDRILDPGDIAPESDDNDNVADFPNTHQQKRVVFLSAALTPDWNRDGKIDQADRGQATAATPWRFWINDDNDSGETGGDDIPQGAGATGTNAADTKANGTRDLVDFFPVLADLRAAFHLLPPNKYRYRFTQAEAVHQPALRLIFANDLTAVASSAYLKVPTSAVKVAYGESRPFNPYGPLPTDGFISAVRDGKGLLLVEGIKPTTVPMVLKIQVGQDNTTVFTSALPVSISGVEAMFRYKYALPNSTIAVSDVPGSPANWPDQDRNGKHFVLAHGYNVSGESARGWGAEFFKRLYWSGSNAMFTIFAWQGNQGQALGLTPDYQVNLVNAFDTARALSNYLELAPGEKALAGHSMGNVLAGAAMTDWNARPASYFMLNAAAATECYDPTEADDPAQDTLMVHPAWRDYDKRLRASEWHRLPGVWTGGDQRASLTWKGRLSGVITSITKTYNFYSSGEEVLNNPTVNDPNLDSANPFVNGDLLWTKPNKMWAMQEKRKGYGITGAVHTSNYGGWKANNSYHPDIHIQTLPSGGWRLRYPAEFTDWTPAFFNSRVTAPMFECVMLPELFSQPVGAGSQGSEYARINRMKLIAEMIPCTTCAAGRNPLKSLIALNRNIDMNATMKTDPERYPTTDAFQEDGDDPVVRSWLHSDIREKAYLHNWNAYVKFVELGNLQ